MLRQSMRPVRWMVSILLPGPVVGCAFDLADVAAGPDDGGVIGCRAWRPGWCAQRRFPEGATKENEREAVVVRARRGAEETRTLYLLTASQTLSQMSYSPIGVLETAGLAERGCVQ